MQVDDAERFARSTNCEQESCLCSNDPDFESIRLQREAKAGRLRNCLTLEEWEKDEETTCEIGPDSEGIFLSFVTTKGRICRSDCQM